MRETHAFRRMVLVFPFQRFIASAPSLTVSAACLVVGLVGLAGCASSPATRFAQSKEYFPESIYGRASPRLVDSGPIPRGGGQYLVGRPYVVAGRLYVPRVMTPGYSEVGASSWYGDAFHGRRTANGEIYDEDAITAAHPTMPLPSYARVTNLGNGRSIIVRVNDRGPYHSGRVMDVSSRVADVLDFKRFGMAHVRVDYIGPASLGGSSNRALLATLRTDGQPAQFAGVSPDLTVAGEPSQPFHLVSSAWSRARSAIPYFHRPSTSAAPETDAGLAPVKASYTPEAARGASSSMSVQTSDELARATSADAQSSVAASSGADPIQGSAHLYGTLAPMSSSSVLAPMD